MSRGLEVITLSPAELDALPEYSATLPTGTTIGKRWKRALWRGDPACGWVMGEYYEIEDPTQVGIRWRRVVIAKPEYQHEGRSADAVPGEWICDQCGFVESTRTLHAHSGAVSVRAVVETRHCPNDGTALRSLTWREVAEMHREQADTERQRAERAEAERARLDALLNTPELVDFPKAVQLEAAHQRERWGSAHDAGKGPEDWFWLVGYLAGKALRAHTAGDREKALHHTISTAAALSNWHAAILGASTAMRPGIGPDHPAHPEHDAVTAGAQP